MTLNIIFGGKWHLILKGPRTTEICILYIGKKAGILAIWNLYIGILLCEISILIQEFCYIVILKLVYWYFDWFSRYIGFLKFGMLVYQTPWSRTLLNTYLFGPNNQASRKLFVTRWTFWPTKLRYFVGHFSFSPVILCSLIFSCKIIYE